MNKDRLRKLADHLDTVAPEKFDLSNWSCGTTACAVGHACTMPEFQMEGLSTSLNTWGRFPKYLEYDSWDAVEAFFDLTHHQARYMFADWCYPSDEQSPSHVAARVRSMVNE